MKTVFAFCAALSFMALGVSAAVATPVPTTLTGTPVSTLPPGVSDAFNIFVGGNRIGGIVVTPADEANCADPVAILGACSFSTQGFQIGSIITDNVGRAAVGDWFVAETQQDDIAHTFSFGIHDHLIIGVND